MGEIRKTDYHECLEIGAKKTPDRVVLIDGQENKAGYGDFLHMYNDTLSFFKENSIKPYDRISLICSRPIDFMIIVVPVIDNATLAVIDPGMDKASVPDRLSLYGVSYIITDDPENHICRVAADMGIGIVMLRITGGLNNRRCLLSMINEKSILIPEYKKKSECIMIGSTSGTTSTPKVVPITYASHNAAIRNKLRTYGYSDSDVLLILTKPHRSQSINAMLLLIKAGGKTILSEGFNHADFFKIIFQYKVTTFSAPPAILGSLVDYMEEHRISGQNSSIRFIRSSGASLPDELREIIERKFDTRVAVSYGMTETRNISSTYGAPLGFRKGSAGLSSGAEVSTSDGEIIIRGETVFDGYENPEIDNDDYFTDGWFHTGDTGYLDKDGYIYITGRLKEMINRGGEKISPYEVEKIIRTHPDVKDAVVFPCPGRRGTENVGAAVVLKSGPNLSPADMRRFLKGKLIAYKIPTLLYVVEEIPISENGKIQRKLLYGILSAACPASEKKTEESRGKGEKLTGQQKKIKRILRNALGKGIDDTNVNFLEAGGDSLSGAAVLSAIEYKFGIRIPVTELFEKGSVAAIDEYLTKKRSAGQSGLLVPVKETGSGKPLICVHSGSGDAETYRHIGRYMAPDIPVMALRFIMKETGLCHPLTFDDLAGVYCDEIKKTYPNGPYYICGHCWGGTLAFLVASKLKKAGCEVAMLAMFDSGARGKHKRKKGTGLISTLLRIIKSNALQLRDNKTKQKFRLIFKKAVSMLKLVSLLQSKKMYSWGASHRSSLIMKLSGKSGALGYASSGYKPEPYEGKIHYFQSSRGLPRNPMNIKYWSSMSEGLELMELDCHHNLMIVGKDAKVLAGILSNIMEGENA